MPSLEKKSVLKQLLTEINISDSLRENWKYLQHHNLQLIDCQLIRIFPKSRENFILLYELELQSAGKKFKLEMFAQWYGNHAEEQFHSLLLKLQKSKRAQLTKERLAEDPVCYLPEFGLVIRKLGIDEKIDGLGLLQQPEMLQQVLEKQLGYRKDSIFEPEIKILGHRLGKRCIARINFQHIYSNNSEISSLFVKWYKTSSQVGQQVHNLTQSLYQQGFSKPHPVRIPKPLGFDKQNNLLLMEHAMGKIFTEMPIVDYEDMLFRAGQAIAKLHQTKIDVAKQFLPDDEIEILNYWVSLTSSVFPELSETLLKALNLIKKISKTILPGKLALVHRDFYEKQILFSDNDATLIDFDTACLSDPAIDLGNFIAHLQLLRLQGESLPIDAEECFINGYGGGCTRDFHHRVMFYKNTTLLRLTCLYSFWPQYRQLPKQLLHLFFEYE